MNQETGDWSQESAKTAEPDSPLPASCPPSSGNAPRSPLRSRYVVLVAGLVVVVGGFALWYFFLSGPRNDLGRLQGDWQVSIGDRVTPNVFRISGNQWQSVGGGIETRAYKISLNEAANPREIDLDPIDSATFRGRKPKLHGIYAFDGDAVRVLLNDTTQPRPKTFDDPEANVWVLRRVILEGQPQP